MTNTIVPFSLKDTPALIEKLLPVQKLSAEAYKEQMAVQSKTLTGLGSYWKGRKPLILNKACVLGCLLPATNDPIRDLEIFEMLMGMDYASFSPRWKHVSNPKELLKNAAIINIREYFKSDPEDVLPFSSPIDWNNPLFDGVKVSWRENISLREQRELEALMLPKLPYSEIVKMASRPEEVMDTVHNHIWEAVNTYLGTEAHNFPQLVEQLGIMRYGRHPKVADTFCGSGQIPFEASRLGCDVFASDLNPVACMLTWGAFNIIGSSEENRIELREKQQELVELVQKHIDELRIETDNNGWRPKAFLYCIECICPQTGWKVPLLSTRIISKGKMAIARLVPNIEEKKYEIIIVNDVSDKEFEEAKLGTIQTDQDGKEPYMVHSINGIQYRNKISTIRGDYKNSEGLNCNRLRLWEKNDFRPRFDDIFQERLFCVQWTRKKEKVKGDEHEFRTVSDADLGREHIVEEYLSEHITEWQLNGWIPDMRIEPGDKTDEPIRTRGWTYWHHLFTPRQLLMLGLTQKYIQASKTSQAELTVFFARMIDWSSKLCRYGTGAARESIAQTFYNQALNPFFTYGIRSFFFAKTYLLEETSNYPLKTKSTVLPQEASTVDSIHDLYITDPPYGDAVNYDEITEFFIAWLRKNPPLEFANWIWDSRRSLAIKGSGEDFRRGMVSAYSRMTERMPDNGIQVIMFTHQSGAIWADMTNIVWASGLQVTAAWYIVTETESALRQGNNVKGTVLLVCRKRHGSYKSTRDDLAWEIQEEVDTQVQSLTGLNQQAKGLYRDENVFEDADIQMAGYAAALRVLTRYATIDGRDMTTEASRPRVKGETTFVDNLIEFAVDTANQCLVPHGIEKKYWDKLNPADRFYLKMLEMEARGMKTLDNYQNFAKAFKVRDFRPLLGSQKANEARLKSSMEFGRAEMNEGSEFYQSVLRAVLYAVMELSNDIDGKDVLAHLMLNIPNYYGDMTQRELAVELSSYLVKQLEGLRPEEARSARILSELLKNQRLG